MRVILLAFVATTAPVGAMTWEDSGDPLLLNFSDEGPMVGLPCPRTDLQTASIARSGSTTEFVMNLADLSFNCIGAHPVGQVYSFDVHFTTPDWPFVWVHVEADAHAAVIRAFLWLRQTDRPESLTVGIEATRAGNAIRASVPSALVGPSLHSIYFSSQMLTCVAGGCSQSGDIYADRLPDSGRLQYGG